MNFQALHPRLRCGADPSWQPPNELPDQVLGHAPNLAAFQLTAVLPLNLELTFLGGLLETPTQVRMWPSVLYSDRRAVQAIGRIDRGGDQNEGLNGTLMWPCTPTLFGPSLLAVLRTYYVEPCLLVQLYEHVLLELCLPIKTH
jgi:hypothetical protein